MTSEASSHQWCICVSPAIAAPPWLWAAHAAAEIGADLRAAGSHLRRCILQGLDILRVNAEFLGGLLLRPVHSVLDRLLDHALTDDDEAGLAGIDEVAELFDLGACHPLGVDLSVACSAESVSWVVTRPDRQRRRAVVSSEGMPGSESPDVGGLAEDLRCGQGGASANVQQRRSELCDEAFESRSRSWICAVS